MRFERQILNVCAITNKYFFAFSPYPWNLAWNTFNLNQCKICDSLERTKGHFMPKLNLTIKILYPRPLFPVSPIHFGLRTPISGIWPYLQNSLWDEMAMLFLQITKKVYHFNIGGWQPCWVVTQSKSLISSPYTASPIVVAGKRRQRNVAAVLNLS